MTATAAECHRLLYAPLRSDPQGEGRYRQRTTARTAPRGRSACVRPTDRGRCPGTRTRTLPGSGNRTYPERRTLAVLPRDARVSDRPYRLLTTDDPDRTFGEALEAGDVTCHPTMLDAANGFVKAERRYRTVVYDDGCEARELTADEQRLLENVCAKLGHELVEVDG